MSIMADSPAFLRLKRAFVFYFCLSRYVYQFRHSRLNNSNIQQFYNYQFYFVLFCNYC